MHRTALFALMLAAGSACTSSSPTATGGDPIHTTGVDPVIGGSLQGRRPFPADNPWNTDISKSPVDPNSVPLCYRVEGKEFVLYSVGWDGKDDGGKFGTWGHYWGSWHASKSFRDARDWLPTSYDFDLGTLNREEPVVEEALPAAEPPASPPEENP